MNINYILKPLYTTYKQGVYRFYVCTNDAPIILNYLVDIKLYLYSTLNLVLVCPEKVTCSFQSVIRDYMLLDTQVVSGMLKIIQICLILRRIIQVTEILQSFT